MEEYMIMVEYDVTCVCLCVHYFSALLDNLRASLFEGCMAVYSELLEGKQGASGTELLQNCALQLWFDVRYLSALLTASERATDKVITLFVLPCALHVCHVVRSHH